jgi:D-isomer specific 2-hydroxyacid dehydrogenase, NAD binding domain
VGRDVVVTTSRGVANSLPIAEYAIAGILHFAMGFNRAAIDRETGAFDHRAYRPLLVQGKTACVVGAGGIGSEVGRLCAALGMRVVGTRRQPQRGAPLAQGFSEIGGDSEVQQLARGRVDPGQPTANGRSPAVPILEPRAILEYLLLPYLNGSNKDPAHEQAHHHLPCRSRRSPRDP